MDPREALILSLKRDIGTLQIENEHLRSALHLHSETPLQTPQLMGVSSSERMEIEPAPKIELEKLAGLEGTELAELVKLYMKENVALRHENAELYTTRETVIRDQEVVCRENERLLKKLEDVNSVCCRSPIIPAITSFSGELMNQSTGSETDANIWRNPLASSMDNVSNRDIMDGRVSSSENRIPESIQKELDKRRIGERYKDQL
jgi:kinesin family member 12